jgi:hypothetical protein
MLASYLCSQQLGGAHGTLGQVAQLRSDQSAESGEDDGGGESHCDVCGDGKKRETLCRSGDASVRAVARAWVYIHATAPE